MSEDLKKFLSVFGPAWLVMIADVDVASIVEGIEAGVIYGAVLVIVMIALTIPLYYIQDAAGRLGSTANLGLGEAIRIKYGRRVALSVSVPLAITDFLEYLAEFAGMAIGLSLLGLSVVLGLVALYVVNLAIVLTKKYRQAEAVLLPISFLLVFTLLLELVLLRPNYSELMRAMLSFRLNYAFFYVTAASIGAVIMPWMLFFHSGADARKRIGAANMKFESLETLLGSIASEVMMAILVVFGWIISESAPDSSLSSIMGYIGSLDPMLRIMMAIGFISSGLLALMVISMASAWGVVEAADLGPRHYYLIYVAESLPALVVALLVRNYLALILSLMIIYSVLLIPLLVMLGQIVTDCSIMKGYALRGRRRSLYWAISAIVSLGSLVGLISYILNP
ncbi:MAG: NRAMP family divalent metal transporter [Nitrososphaeria archaeon]